MESHSMLPFKIDSFFIFYFYFYFLLFRAEQWHMEVPRQRVKSELQLPAYTTATATWNLSCICDLHCSSWQHWILNQLSKARDRTRNLMVTSWIHFHCATMGTPSFLRWFLIICSISFDVFQPRCTCTGTLKTSLFFSHLWMIIYLKRIVHWPVFAQCLKILTIPIICCC